MLFFLAVHWTAAFAHAEPCDLKKLLRGKYNGLLINREIRKAQGNQVLFTYDHKGEKRKILGYALVNPDGKVIVSHNPLDERGIFLTHAPALIEPDKVLAVRVATPDDIAAAQKIPAGGAARAPEPSAPPVPQYTGPRYSDFEAQIPRNVRPMKEREIIRAVQAQSSRIVFVEGTDGTIVRGPLGPKFQGMDVLHIGDMKSARAIPYDRVAAIRAPEDFVSRQLARAGERRVLVIDESGDRVIGKAKLTDDRKYVLVFDEAGGQTRFDTSKIAAINIEGTSAKPRFDYATRTNPFPMTSAELERRVAPLRKKEVIILTTDGQVIKGNQLTGSQKQGFSLRRPDGQIKIIPANEIAAVESTREFAERHVSLSVPGAQEVKVELASGEVIVGRNAGRDSSESVYIDLPSGTRRRVSLGQIVDMRIRSGSGPPLSTLPNARFAESAAEARRLDREIIITRRNGSELRGTVDEYFLDADGTGWISIQAGNGSKVVQLQDVQSVAVISPPAPGTIPARPRPGR